MYHSIGRLRESLDFSKQAMKCDNVDSTSGLIYFLFWSRSTYKWTDYDPYARKLITGKNFSPSHVSLLPYLSPEEMLQISMCYTSRIAVVTPAEHLWSLRCNHPNKSDKTRVGYISSKFGIHVIRNLARSIYLMHDHLTFELCFYSLCPDSAVDRPRWKVGFGRLVDLSKMTPCDASTRIQKDSVDVLVSFDCCTNSVDRILSLQPQVQMFDAQLSSGAPCIQWQTKLCFRKRSTFSILKASSTAVQSSPLTIASKRQKSCLMMMIMMMMNCGGVEDYVFLRAA